LSTCKRLAGFHEDFMVAAKVGCGAEAPDHCAKIAKVLAQWSARRKRNSNICLAATRVTTAPRIL
jgi:hypothetical protein